ncbi:hypothetical protein [Tolypothrix sp. NIES-4075]|uniref:hypothetical protein n=1 Tax=Tolypothrix sp. NIES-4075 TaxID=2005459 RepID=UPI000B5CED12|nr:hypothetical protein [Tolypothrix sp. NIES-4075]
MGNKNNYHVPNYPPGSQFLQVGIPAQRTAHQLPLLYARGCASQMQRRYANKSPDPQSIALAHQLSMPNAHSIFR